LKFGLQENKAFNRKQKFFIAASSAMYLFTFILMYFFYHCLSNSSIAISSF